MALTIVQLPKRLQSKIEVVDGHWRWTGANKGRDADHLYGVTWDGKRTVRAVRYVWELLVSEIPEGMTIDHLCGMTLCVNPEHMELVSNRENILRARTHRDLCPQGHPLDRTRINRGRVIRFCSICHNANWHRWKAKKGGLH